MPLEQSKIVIAPAFITHANLKNIPKGPMTSKQLKKSYKERNAGPKMSKAERRKEERELIEKNRLEQERETRLEREKRKRDKKKADEEAAKLERRKMGVPEKSRFVRPSQNRITGFLGKRTRDDDSAIPADDTTEGSVMGDMRPPKNKRLSVESKDNDYGYASHEHDMDTAMLDITMPVDEDDISTVDSQEDNQERTLPKAASQRRARPMISDDEMEPMIEKFRSGQLAQALDFGTIRTQTDDSSFISVGKFKTPTQVPRPSLPDPFAASQDYLAQFSDDEAPPANSNTSMAEDILMTDANPVTPFKPIAIPTNQAQKTPPAAWAQDEIHTTYSPIKARPSESATLSKTPAIGQFDASQDYDSYFATQAPAQKSSPKAKKKTPKEASQRKARPVISDDDDMDYDAIFATQAVAAPKPSQRSKSKTPKKTQPRARPKISDDEVDDVDYDAYFATQAPKVVDAVVATIKGISNVQPLPRMQPPAKPKVSEPPKIDPPSQDYDAMFATQAPAAPLAHTVSKKVATNLNTPAPMQPPDKPVPLKTPVTGQFDASQDYDGFFSPDAPHAKPFQKALPPRTPAPPEAKPQNAAQGAIKKLLNADQIAASQDYLAMLGDDDDDYDADITPDFPAPKVTMSPQNIAKHYAYNQRQIAKVIKVPGISKQPTRLPPAKTPTPAELRQQALNRFKMPVTPSNVGPSRQPAREGLSVAQNNRRPPHQPGFKPQLQAKQTYTPVQRTPKSMGRPFGGQSAPPPLTQVLEVGDDFEVQTPSQLMRELTEDGSLSRNVTSVPFVEQSKDKKSTTGTKHNLSDHLPWLLKHGAGGSQRPPLQPVQQDVVRPPSFELQRQKRASYPPNKPANTGAKRFLSTNAANIPRSVPKPGPDRAPTAPRFVQRTPTGTSKPAPKALPSIEVDDMMDLDFPSNTQVMREIEEDDRERSRSLSVAPIIRPSVPQPPTKNLPQQNPVAREPTPVYKSFETNSQLMREMAEQEAEEKAKRASATPCPPAQQQAPTTAQKQSKTTSTKPSVEPVSFDLASDELESLSQIARELAEDDALAKNTQKAAQKPNIPCPNPVSKQATAPLATLKTPKGTKNKPLNPSTGKHRPKMRFEAGDFRPLPPDQLARELPHDDAEAKRRADIAIKRNKPDWLPEWLGGEEGVTMWFESPQPDPMYSGISDVEDGAHGTHMAEMKKQSKSATKPIVKVKDVMDLELSFDIPSNSQLMSEMAEEEKLEKQARKASAPVSAQKPFVAPSLPASTASSKPAQAAKGDWLTRTAIAKNAVGRKPTPLSRTAAIYSKPNVSSPLVRAARIFEPESNSQIAHEIAEEAEAFIPRHNTLHTAPKRTPPFPLPSTKSSRTRRQFSGLAPVRRSAPPPSSPFQPPPSAQPVPSSTPIDIKRARKPPFFPEKPEDRESSLVFDSKLLAEREERRRRDVEVEQGRQDEWLRELLGGVGG